MFLKAEFLTSLYGALPDCFTHEDGLRHPWSDPETRQALLHGLEERGFGQEALSEMRKVIEAEDSDTYDVLRLHRLRARAHHPEPASGPRS